MSWPRYANYRSADVDWLPEVPADWTLSRLGFEAWVRARLGWKGLKADEYVDQGVAFLSTPDIRQRRINFDNVARITEARYDESPEIKLSVGDVLLAKDGSTLGSVNIVQHLPEPTTVNGSIAVITPGKRLDGVYLRYLIASDFLQNRIQMLKGGMGVPHLFQDDIRRFDIPLPSLKEQQSVGMFLDRETTKIDALIAKQEQLIATLREDRTATITHVVTKGVFPHAETVDSGVEWLGEIPRHWSLSRFSRHVGINSGQVDPRLPPFCDMPLIAPNHVESGTGRLLLLETASEQGADSGKYVIAEGQIIYSKIRPNLAKAVVAPCDALCSADMYGLMPDAKITTQFLLYVLLSKPFTDYVIDSSMRVAMPKVNHDSLGAAPLWTPPIPEQQEICAFLSNRLKSIDALSAKAAQVIEILREYRSALITDAVTGKIDVRGAA